MNSTSKLAVIDGGALVQAVPHPRTPAVVGRSALTRLSTYAQVHREKERTSQAMLLVTLLHVLALLWLLNPLGEAPAQQPVLAFTVTMMDLSSSPNSISSAASARSIPAPVQAAKPVKKVKATQKAAIQKAAATPQLETPAPQNNSPLSHNAAAQTSVLAPITPAQFDAAYLQNPAPQYPPLSRRLGEQGRVLLSVYVNEKGQAENIKIKKGSGFTRLDDAAMDSVRAWRFAAARRQDQLIASWVIVPVNFVLE